MQKHAISDWSSQNSFCRKRVYQDHGISGSTAPSERPGLVMLMHDMRMGKLDTVLVYRLDRLSRNSSDAIRLILELDDLGIKFISITQPILSDQVHSNPFRKTMLAAMAEIAELERATTIERVKVGLAAAKARGVTLGRPRVYTEQQRAMVVEMRRQGESLRKIAKTTGISLGTVANILRPDAIKPDPASPN